MKLNHFLRINNILLQLSLYIGKNIKLVIVRQITEPKAGPVINIPMIIILLFPVKYVFAIFGIPTEIIEPPNPKRETANNS